MRYEMKKIEDEKNEIWESIGRWMQRILYGGGMKI